MAYVYKHICPNGKVYIGRTDFYPERRWKNGEGYLGQRFYYAIMEFGWNNIKHIILYDNLTHEESKQIEAQEIIKHKSFLSSRGYNVDINNCNIRLTKGQKKRRNKNVKKKDKIKQYEFFTKQQEKLEGGLIEWGKP